MSTISSVEEGGSIILSWGYQLKIKLQWTLQLVSSLLLI